MAWLVPYKFIYNHEDPLLSEFTYGDVRRRGRMMRNNFLKGDYVFFHASIEGKKYITAYYVVDRVLDTAGAVKDKLIVAKYKNPHLKMYLQNPGKYQDDVILFGDPILSRKLERPLLFDKNLASQLSLSIKFKDGFTDTQIIGSAARNWRKLSKADVNALLGAIKANDQKGIEINKVFSTNEVTEIIERDLENFLETTHHFLGDGLKVVRRQFDTPVGRMDLVFENKKGKMIIAELKLNKIGREAINQLRRYMDYLEKETNQAVKGLIVCSGVMPAFEDELRHLKNIEIYRYGWELKVLPV